MFSNNPLLEHFEMFRVRHCRVTSLASGMLWMILPGPPTAPVKPALSKAEGRSLGWFEGHTVCDSPPPSQRTNVAVLRIRIVAVFWSRISLVDEKIEPDRAELKLAQDVSPG